MTESDTDVDSDGAGSDGSERARGSESAGTESVTGRGFCDAILPALIMELGPALARVEAVVQLYITSEREDLARVVTLDATEDAGVVAGEDPEADLVMAIEERVLPQLLAGTLDVERSIAEGDIDVDADGDVDALARIAQVFGAAASPLSTRLAAMSAARVARGPTKGDAP